MTTGQAQIKLRVGNSLEVDDTTANVATNKAMLAALSAANVDGKDIYPQSISTQRLNLSEWLTVGGGVTLTEGCVRAEHIIQSEAVITESIQVGSNVITEDAISVPNLAAINADLGTITAGSMAIGSGGVTIGNASAGIFIGANQIYSKYDGVTTVLIDGATGKITCSKFELTADSSSTITLNQGTHIFSEGIQVGSTTLGGINSTANSALSIANDAHGDAATAYTLADSAIKPGGGVSVDTQKYITTIDMSSGIVIRSGNATARTQMTSNGIAVYNSSGGIVSQVDHTNGIAVVNFSSSPGVTERYSIMYNNGYSSTEYGWLAAYGTNVYLQAINGAMLTIDAADEIHIHSTDTDDNGIELRCDSVGITINAWLNIGSVSGPRIGSGSAPSQGSSAGGLPYGTLRLATGGSLWLVDGSGNWDRVRTYNYNP